MNIIFMKEHVRIFNRPLHNSVKRTLLIAAGLNLHCIIARLFPCSWETSPSLINTLYSVSDWRDTVPAGVWYALLFVKFFHYAHPPVNSGRP